MGRREMRNLEIFRVGDSQVNEFEYQKHQGEMTEQLDQHPDEIARGPKPLTQAERVKQITAAAHKKVEKKRKKEAGKSGSPSKKTVSRSAASGKGSKKVAAKAGSKKKPANKRTGRKTLSAVSKKTTRKK